MKTSPEVVTVGGRDGQNATARIRYPAARLAAKAAVVFGIGPRFFAR